MRGPLRLVLVLLLLAPVLVGCAQAPTLAQVQPELPPAPAGEARLFFYRWLEPYETLAWTPVYLNGRTVGVAQPGAVFYRDVPPGVYMIAVRSEGIYPNQFKTVAVAPGQTLYVRIESLASWDQGGGGLTGGDWRNDTFVVHIVEPDVGRSEAQTLRFSRG